MKKQKGLGNKGFSLVELIIVIAIMAILVGVMAPQLLKYVEKSRQSTDIQAADTVRTAIVTAMLDPAVDDAPTSGYASLTALYADTTHPKFVAAVKEIINETVATNVEGAGFISKAYKTQLIKITITGTNVTVEVAVNAGATGSPIKIE